MLLNELTTALELWEQAINAKIAAGIHMEESPRRFKVRYNKLNEICRMTGTTPEVESFREGCRNMKVDYNGFRIVAVEDIAK